MSRNDPRPTNNSKLAQLRIARGMTQTQLAEKVGCTQKDISRWEHGTRTPASKSLILLSQALGCSVDDLV